jgi:hypothetical protein
VLGVVTERLHSSQTAAFLHQATECIVAVALVLIRAQSVMQNRRSVRRIEHITNCVLSVGLMVAGGALELDIGQVIEPVITIDHDVLSAEFVSQAAKMAALQVFD